ncbi:MAG: hypothetical protein GY853_05975 [PVC group bacterium]|nr:hypothetical protein [PVC group bacterium]
MERQIITDGPHTLEVLRVLSGTIKTDEGLKSISDKASEIIVRSVDPVAGDAKISSDGLLYGLIQSGKTSIITVAAAMAADNGFQCIIILTSDIDLLYEQTLERVKRTLRGSTVLGKKDWKDLNKFARHLRTFPLVIVCSKNSSRLNKLLEALKTTRAKGLSVLIIDDEADQASLNTKTSKRLGEISGVNRVITGIREFFPINTYLQVTATPQALFLQRPDHKYRPSFTVLSNPGDGYVGGATFFDDDQKVLRNVDLHEVDSLKATHQPTLQGKVPRGLRKALYVFLVGATVKIIRKEAEGYAFLCHVSLSQKDHKYIETLLGCFKEDLIKTLQDTSTAKYTKLTSDLKNAYDDLSKTDSNLPPFDKIVDQIKFYISGTSIQLINATTSEEIKLEAAYNMLVGGNKLGRGVTIKNLIVSYYGRNPKRPNADTVLQHARMYGYREKDVSVIRLFLPERLAEHFKLIHKMEEALRDLVSQHPIGEFEGLYISSPLHATRRNVLDPNSLGMYVAGRSYNPSYPLRTSEIVEDTKYLDNKLAQFQGKQFTEVTIDFIIEMLKHCRPDPNYDIELWEEKNLLVAIEQIKKLGHNKAYLVVVRNRDIRQSRHETQGIISGGEEALAPKDAPTLFIYRMNEISWKQKAVWWPQLRFPDGNYVLAFSFDW